MTTTKQKAILPIEINVNKKFKKKQQILKVPLSVKSHVIVQLFPGIVSCTGVLQVQATWGRMEESKGWQQKTSRGNRQENGMKDSMGY